MIWSFIKTGIFIALAAALAFGATTIMETGGEIRIAFGGQELSLTPLMFIIIVVLTFIAVLVLLKLVGALVAVLRFVNGDETAISRYFDRNREARGYDALQDSLVALAAGDGKTAVAKATRAERFLERKPLTALVHAQAAQLTGNKSRAMEHYKTLLKDDKTRFVGVQGLLAQKLEEGDTDRALQLATKAFALNPAHDGTLTTLFKLQTDRKDWNGARETLLARVRSRALPRDIGKRREAVLAVAGALADAEDHADRALDAANRANKLAPDLVPAAVLAAGLHAKRGEVRKAAAITRKAWALSPHPDIAAAHAAIVPDETPEARLKRFKPLLTAQPDHPETRLLSAELYLAAEDFPAARKAIGDLAETDPTARSMAIMAAISRGMGDDEATVSGFLARALSAPRGDAWVCEKCNHIHGTWAPLCENCDSFDTLAWSRVPVSDDQRTMAAAMLPLIIGDRLGSDPDEMPDEAPDEPPAEETPPQPKDRAQAMAEDAEILEKET